MYEIKWVASMFFYVNKFLTRSFESIMVCVLGTLESTLQILQEAGEMDWDLMRLFTLTGKQL